MTAALDENVGTEPVRPGFAFDVAGLDRWMTSNVPGYHGPLSVEQFKGGQSNPTYKLETPQRKYVLRRKPSGQLLKGAHAIDREARVLTALGGVGFPAPHVHALCMDDTVIGTAFYVMDCVEGRIFWDASLADTPAFQRAPIFDAMNATIAALHAIDPASIGMEDYGAAGNYCERQIARWSKQYIEDVEAGRDSSMDKVIAWLQAHIPALRFVRL